jgi:hypothetical protein
MKQLKSRSLATIILILACVSASPLFADSLVLRNGEHVQGKFAGGTQGVIAFVTDRGTVYYNVTDVLAMTFEAEDIEPYNGSSATPKLPSSGNNLQPQAATPPKIKGRQKRQVRLAQQTNTPSAVHKPGAAI